MIAFSKYHGCGNNFVIVRETQLREYLAIDEIDEGIEEAAIAKYRQFAVRACDVNIGVGADGLIVVREQPQLEMVFFNRDGSRAPMCGNGIRCFAHYCSDNGIRSEDSYPVKTLAGDMIVDVASRDPFAVKINMGAPVYSPRAICVDDDGDDFLGRQIELAGGRPVAVDSLFMGTVHTVVFVEDTRADYIEELGRQICNHSTYTEKTNVNFVKVIDEETIEVRTYERGVGMTLACGTGACASVVVSAIRGLCRNAVKVILELGSLTIYISDDGNVYMEGPSVKIMDGEFC